MLIDPESSQYVEFRLVFSDSDRLYKTKTLNAGSCSTAPQKDRLSCSYPAIWLHCSTAASCLSSILFYLTFSEISVWWWLSICHWNVILYRFGQNSGLLSYSCHFSNQPVCHLYRDRFTLLVFLICFRLLLKITFIWIWWAGTLNVCLLPSTKPIVLEFRNGVFFRDVSSCFHLELSGKNTIYVDVLVRAAESTQL